MKKFCYTCGTEVQRAFEVFSFNEDTGEPIQVETRTCPKAETPWLKHIHPVVKSHAIGKDWQRDMQNVA